MIVTVIVMMGAASLSIQPETVSDETLRFAAPINFEQADKFINSAALRLGDVRTAY